MHTKRFAHRYAPKSLIFSCLHFTFLPFCSFHPRSSSSSRLFVVRSESRAPHPIERLLFNIFRTRWKNLIVIDSNNKSDVCARERMLKQIYYDIKELKSLPDGKRTRSINWERAEGWGLGWLDEGREQSGMRRELFPLRERNRGRFSRPPFVRGFLFLAWILCLTLRPETRNDSRWSRWWMNGTLASLSRTSTYTLSTWHR